MALMRIVATTAIAAGATSATTAASHFPRVTVINLPRHGARRANVTRELRSRNVPFTFLDAVDGSNLTMINQDPNGLSLSRNATFLGRWFMTPGMIGCFLSHRKCWTQCVKSGEPLLVLEDDVVLAENFREVVLSSLQQLRVASDDASQSSLAWDVLLLGALGCVHPDKKYGVNWLPSLVGGKWRQTRPVGDPFVIGAATEPQQSKQQQKEEIASIHVPLCPYGMHAYLLSPAGAAKLLRLIPPRATYHVDVVAWGKREVNILAVHPLVVWQTHLDTTIGSGSSGGSSGGVITKLLRRLLNHQRSWLRIEDHYTGFELGWALENPLLRVGGPLFRGKCVLTIGGSLAIMATGFLSAWIFSSKTILAGTLVYVAAVTALVRLLASKWNF